MKFGKIFARFVSPQPDDPFLLLPLCMELGLRSEASKILAACRPSVVIELAQIAVEIAHTASRLGGRPALPDRFDWPLSQSGEPMKFLAQLACPELVLAKLTGLPEEGLLSVFLDRTNEKPREAQVFHFSLKRDLLLRASPDGPAEMPTYRPQLHTIPSLPRPGSAEFEALTLDPDSESAYFHLLVELEDSLESGALRCGGHPPFSDEDAGYPEGGPENWKFLLAILDIEELSVFWPESGCVLLWIPKDMTHLREGAAEITWQTVDSPWSAEDDDVEGDEEEDPEDEEEEDEEEDDHRR